MQRPLERKSPVGQDVQLETDGPLHDKQVESHDLQVRVAESPNNPEPQLETQLKPRRNEPAGQEVH